MTEKISLKVNGEEYTVSVPPDEILTDTLRNRLGLTGTKKGCGSGECGSCTVIVSGKPVNSCILLSVKAAGKDILTIEGLGDSDKLHPLQEKFKDHGAVQCGYCGPGMLMASKALLDENPNPTEEEIREGLAGNLCRCSGYVKIIDAVKAAAQEMGK